MKKAIYAVIGLGVAALVAADSEGTSLLNKSIGAINAPATLKAVCSVQLIGSAPSNVSLELGKPNLAKIDGAARLVVADGTDITTYDKTARTYFKQPETPQLLAKALNDAGVGVWNAFFDAKGIKGAQDVRVLPAVTRKGVSLTPVQFSKEGVQTAKITYYLGSDLLPRQEEETVTTPKGEEVTVLSASSIVLGNAADPAKFAFKAPDGSRELTAAEMNADKWYTNFNEALAAAKSSNRLVLVDFYTSWCHWCKVLRAEVFPKDEFKAMSKYYVFCEIDAEAEPSLASRYGVDAYPTSVFVDGDGNQVHKLVGYKPLAEYVAEMDSARQSAGK